MRLHSDFAFTGNPANRLPAAALAGIAALLLGACAADPPRESGTAQQDAVVSTQVYFYPSQGQSAEQQDRDRYECYLWSKKQTGFDPSSPRLLPHQRLDVAAAPPPGEATAAGAVGGAVLGAIVAPRGQAVEGAVLGAMAGAAVGAASEAARRNEADSMQRRIDAAQLERQAADYRRAMTACLEGRGYSVR